jgi:PAS domain S-box-containing protein
VQKPRVAKERAKSAAKLKVLAKDEKSIQAKLTGTAKGLRVNAKQLAVMSKEKGATKRKLAATAGNLRVNARQLSKISKKQETVTSELALPEKEKSSEGIDPTVTAETLHRKSRQLSAKSGDKTSGKSLTGATREKQKVRQVLSKTAEKLSLKARQLGAIGRENEAVKARLAKIAKDKEMFRRRLTVSAENLRLKARQLATIAKENDKVRGKLAVTAESLRIKAKRLAEIAKENESNKSKLALIAKEKESMVRRLEVAAEDKAARAEQLAVTAKEKEAALRTLAATAENLRLKAENLEHLKAEDEAIISSIGEGLVVTDTSGKIQFVNDAFVKLFGWTEPEVEGKLFTEILPMVDGDGTRIPLDGHVITRAVEERVRTSHGDTVKFVRKDQTTVPIAVTIEPIVVGTDFRGTVAILRDITKESAVDVAKTEFVSLASHQLRTPLSASSWYAEMLLTGDAGALNIKQRSYLEKVYKSNRRMVDLVDALLNVSRLELGTFTIEPEPTDAIRIAKKSIDELRFLIARRHIRFNERYEEGLPQISTDPKLLAIIMQNLLPNAVKYTPEEGEVSLELRTVKSGESIDGKHMTEDRLAITVKDSGYGIPEDQQARIFTKLFRADNVRAMDTEGTGLGLYIVKSIIDHSGGTIWFRSSPNQGSTFTVTLPMTGIQKDGTKKLE